MKGARGSEHNRLPSVPFSSEKLFPWQHCLTWGLNFLNGALRFQLGHSSSILRKTAINFGHEAGWTNESPKWYRLSGLELMTIVQYSMNDGAALRNTRFVQNATLHSFQNTNQEEEEEREARTIS